MTTHCGRSLVSPGNSLITFLLAKEKTHLPVASGCGSLSAAKLVLLSSPDALPRKTHNSCRHSDRNSLHLPGDGIHGQHEVSCFAPGGAAAPRFPRGILRRTAPGDQAAYADRQSCAAHSRADVLLVFCSSCFPIHS